MSFLKKHILFLFLAICTSFSVKSQVEVFPQSGLNSLLEKHISSNKNMQGKLQGYRIQIFFESGNNSREKAVEVRNNFASKYSKISAYVTFKEPNFRVRVGDFRTRMEARGFQEMIKGSFPQSFVVKDDVNYPKN